MTRRCANAFTECPLTFGNDTIANFLLEYYDIENHLVPDIVDTFGIQSTVDEKGEEEIKLNKPWRNVEKKVRPGKINRNSHNPYADLAW